MGLREARGIFWPGQRRVDNLNCRIFSFIIMVAMGLLLTSKAAAQSIPTEQQLLDAIRTGKLKITDEMIEEFKQALVKSMGVKSVDQDSHIVADVLEV